MSQSPIDFDELFAQLRGSGRPGRRGPGGAGPNRPPAPRHLPWRPMALAALVVAILALIGGGATFITDAWWFASLGQAAVFRQRIVAPLAVFGAAAAIGFLWLAAQWWWATRGVTAEARFSGQRGLGSARRPLAALLTVVAAVVAVSIASGAAGLWPQLLAWQHRRPFGTLDPLFGRDVAFYVFSLPLLRAAQAMAWSWLLAAFVGCAVVYAVGGALDLRRGRFTVGRRARAHLSALAALGALLWAFGEWLARFNLLFADRSGDSFFGPGYTDATVRLFGHRALIAVGIAVAVGFAASIAANRLIWPLGLIAGALALQALLVSLVPMVVQQYRVGPNELDLERPYIQHNIDLTRKAWGIDAVTERPFAPKPRVDRAALEAEGDALTSVRLWDWRVMHPTVVQLQALRKYYDFLDVDVDRYTLASGPRQTLIAARELVASALPNRTWVNTHLKYTHGYGAVLNPVDEVGPQGRPVLWLRDIPISTRPPFELDVAEARIYFGESPGAEYVVVGTRGGEFDATAPESEVRTTRYDGADGVGIGSRWRRLLFAIRFGDTEPLLSPEITAESKVLFRRTITERIRALAPFLTLDADPYLVVSPEGRLVWIVDAYTATDRYPYSRPIRTNLSATGAANYVRNSVKVVVDAYDGRPTFYVVDDTDPLIAAWQGAFPTLFRPAAEMPAGLRAHWRYPEGLFRLQAEIYTRYHITAAVEFYNANDVWVFPAETFEAGSGRQVTQPYYVTLRLHDQAASEFVLMLPFTPRERQNLVGWLAGRSDGEAYGQLVAYRFHEGEQYYGPAQIESVIDQDTEISQQLTLWGQSGSQVVRGNLLIIPLGETLLYVEPLYLAATSSDALPELKRVIVADNERVVMRPTLDEALSALVGGGPAVAEPPADDGDAAAAPARPAPARPAPAAAPDLPADAGAAALAAFALERRQAAQDALASGDWEAFGREMSQLDAALDRLAVLTGADAAADDTGPGRPVAATPTPSPGP